MRKKNNVKRLPGKDLVGGLRKMGRVVCVSMLLWSLLGSSAAVANVLSPGTDRHIFALAFGPSYRLQNIANQFKFAQLYGYRLSSRGHGPYIGIAVEESVGNGTVSVQAAPRFGWDIRPFSSVALYLSPYVSLGYAYVSSGTDDHYLGFQFGFEPKVIFDKRYVLFARAYSSDFFIRSGDYGVRYDLLLGAGLTF